METKVLDSAYSFEMSVVLSVGLLVPALMLVTFIASSKPSRVGMILLGLLLVLLGGFGYVHFSMWAWAGAKHVESGLLSASVYEQFKAYKGLLVYIFPFVSAAIGTNLISDAITNHQSYEKRFSLIEFFRDIGLVLMVPIVFAVVVAMTPFLVCFTVFKRFREPAKFYLASLWRWVYLQTLKISIIARLPIKFRGRRDAL